MLFDDVYGFNQEWAKTKSKADFVAEFMGHEHIFPEMKAADKTARLEQVWKTLRNEPEEAAPIPQGEVAPAAPMAEPPSKKK